MKLIDWLKDTATGGLAYAGYDSYQKSIMSDLSKQLGDAAEAQRKQSEITQDEINSARAAQDVEKRRIEEKQIRAMRNQYRPTGGFLNNQALGGQSTLPNKLGQA